MDQKRFEEIVAEQNELCMSVLLKKAEEYATEDRLHNFKVAAALQGITKEQALAGFLAKHIVSIYDMCMSGKLYSTERWNEKIGDAINYLYILRAIVEDSNRKDFN